MGTLDALELLSEPLAAWSPVTMDITSTPVLDSDDISNINKDQMETQDVMLFISQSLSQKAQDDGQTESGTVLKSYEMNTEHNLEMAKESDQFEFPMDEGNCKHSANGELESNTKPEDDEQTESGTVSKSYTTLHDLEIANESDQCAFPTDEDNCKHSANDKLESNTKPEDDGQTESGTLMQNYKMMTELNFEIAKESDQSPMEEDNSIHANKNPSNGCPIVVKAVGSEPSDVESSSDTAVNRPGMSSDTVQTVKKPTRNGLDKQTLEFTYKIIRFMKEYYEMNPSARPVEIQRAMIRQLNLERTETTSYLAYLIKLYRNVGGVMESHKCSFEDLDEEFCQQCPFYKELHEALQLSDFYRNSNGKRGRPRNKEANKKRVRFNSSRNSSASGENIARTKVWNKTPKTKSELMYSNTKSTEDEDQMSSEMMDKKFIPNKEKLKGREKLDRRMNSNSYELYRSIAMYMKEYFKKNPSSSKTDMLKAYREETKSPFPYDTVLRCATKMIKSYRELRLEFDGFKSCSSSHKKKLISERCPFFDDIHEAYQNSDFYRNSHWEPGRKSGAYPRFHTKRKCSTSTTSTSSKDNENEKSLEHVQVKVEPVECGQQQDVNSGTQVTLKSSPIQKARNKREASKTNAEPKINKGNKEALEWTPELQIMFARFMRDYYKKNPSATMTALQKAMYKHFDLQCNMNGFRYHIESMIRTYRILRHQLGNPDGYSESLKKELKLKRCPYFFELHDAFQYSDFYRNCKWTPKRQPPGKTSRLQPTTSNASSDDEMETADETAVCFQSLSTMFPKPVKRPSNEGDNLERSLNEKELMNVVPPVKTLDGDHKQAGSDNAAIETSPLEVPDGDHKQDCINDPVEQDKAINPAIISKSKLSSEQHFELIKLEDRKEERQFQLKMTKMKQEYEIEMLKLQIKFERVKNLKQ